MLVAEALRRADRRGYRTLAGRATEFESDLPFAVFVDALDDALSETGAPLEPAERAPLAPILPSLATAEPPPAPDPRRRVLRLARTLLGRLAAERPLVLALDDLHWADPPSVDLLCHLLHRRVDAPLLLVLAARPAQGDPRLMTALHEAERSGLAQRLELAPLTAAEAHELLGDQADAVYEDAGGNPFYLEQLTAAARRGAATDAPHAVRAAIDAEIERLTPPARTLVQAAAVVADPFEPDLAAAATGLPEQAALAALDELLARDVVRPADAAGRFRFRHPIVRRAVYESAGPGWRLATHRRVAAALAERGATPASRAHHLELAARPGDEDAIAVLAQAGREAAAQAPTSAARWFAAALRLMPDRPEDRDRRLALLVERAAALGVAGHVEENREALRAYLRLSPVEGNPLRLQAAVLASILDELLGQPEPGQRRLLEELERLPDASTPEAAELKRMLAVGNLLEADWAAGLEWSEAAVAADARGMTAVGAHAGAAVAAIGVGQVDGAREHTAAAAALFDAMTDAELIADQPGAAGWLGWAEVGTEQLDAAIAHLRRARAASRRSMQRPLVVGLLVAEGQSLQLQGRIDELGEVAELALEEALLSPSHLITSWAMSLKCAYELRRGDLYAAVRFGEQCVGEGAAVGSPLAQVGRL
ncbi:MAG: hypothetical protein QOG63_2314, partial [Thermoleophilaceae bacterium]|nr:hypothetical protein [Thermoleophilaceae bacterium]